MLANDRRFRAWGMDGIIGILFSKITCGAQVRLTPNSAELFPAKRSTSNYDRTVNFPNAAGPRPPEQKFLLQTGSQFCAAWFPTGFQRLALACHPQSCWLEEGRGREEHCKLMQTVLARSRLQWEGAPPAFLMHSRIDLKPTEWQN